MLTKRLNIQLSFGRCPSARSRNLGWIMLATVGTFMGCADGPFYHMKKANPYFRAQWEKDRELGPIFSDRLGELEKLKSQLPSMAASEQEQWSSHLLNLVKQDPSSEMRAQAVAVLGQLSGESATSGLNIASGDDVEKVRLAACKAWKQRGDQAARDMLLSMAQSDESPSVRQAAIDGLGVFKDEPEVKSALTGMLSDRSPAIQYQAAQSLKSITGKDYGGDFDAWQRYMAGENVAEPVPLSTAEKLWNSLPSWR